MTLTTPGTRFAGPVDTERYGEYRVTRRPDDPRPLYRFTGRLSSDGSTPFHAEPGRYHLYAGWFCPWAQRVVLQVAANGLLAAPGGEGALSVSYVDDARDARGWAFRETHGPDPVNGFTLLRDAYEATEPGFDGHVSVPTLWDTTTGRVVSNDYTTLGIDIATQFGGSRWPGVDTYPVHLREEIEALDAWVGPAVNQGAGRARGQGPAAEQARVELRGAFDRLDALLVDRSFLVGHGLTEADFRLWVSLARYDVQTNATGEVGPPLSAWPELARYAGWLADLPAFRATTRWASFTAPGTAPSFLPPAAAATERTSA
ncbi:glutathione S-transferase C-terminal domain-containing protein [Microlunatus capsulatus]|uniref:Glutathionyl-hydroquinone reductase n=1 Tax=Microlunatus capsulatus TaxID=99117 RepID=A0ABS4Z238_9ACTN|nr:glutathione S-transferase C-terminal domain-containing protein [Microlunatus capsulatus]MBP2415121.1 glutathionyl-hydroquinone reductase [Microlunatus capsulatus]